jgi:DNA-binding transcriptional regulator YiaG
MNTSPASLREFRQSRHLSQPQIAELLNTPVGTWKNWEQGRTVPPGCLAVALESMELRDEVLTLRISFDD